jgi:hypothetical protein
MQEVAVSNAPMLVTKDACADSLRARTWLVERGLAFAECNLDREPARAAEALGARVTAAPLLVTERGVVFGYRPAAYGECLQTIARTEVAPPIRRVAN